MHTRFIELAGEINFAMPAYVVEKTMDALNEQEATKAAVLVPDCLQEDVTTCANHHLWNSWILRKKGADVAYSTHVRKLSTHAKAPVHP